MGGANPLEARIQSVIRERETKLKQAQAERAKQSEAHLGRLGQFEKTCDELSAIWKPRLETFAKQFGDQIKATPKITPSRREVTFGLVSDLANVTLRISVTTDSEVRSLVLDSDLQIIPVLMKYDRSARLEMPLDKIDRDAIGKWIEDRLVHCVETYLSIQDNEFYLRQQMVTDPVSKQRFPRHTAAASIEWKGDTYFFSSESNLAAFRQQNSVTAS